MDRTLRNQQQLEGFSVLDVETPSLNQVHSGVSEDIMTSQPVIVGSLGNAMTQLIQNKEKL